MPAARRVYTLEFKRQAVEMVRAPGSTLSGTARNLGVGQNALRRWVQASQVEQRDLSAPLDEDAVQPQARIRQLERENAVLRQEREILKAAAAFFARESR